MASSFAFSWLISVFLLGTGAVANAASPMSTAEHHEQWMALHGRVYPTLAEKDRRLKIFEYNVNYIESFNRAGEHNYTLGVNQFADMTNDEFVAASGPSVPTSAQALSSSRWRAPPKGMNNTKLVVPAAVDWRDKGAVTSVKSQAYCGSCWALAAVAAMEGAVKLQTGKLIELSAQEVVDCDRGGRDNGCHGGFMDGAFQFIIKNGGLTTEANYPYKATQSPCDATKKASAAATITGYQDVARDQAALLQVVARQPVSIGIDNRGRGFQFYSSGVFTGPCGSSINHAVAAVGYGATADGTKYWLMKNSWGKGWGEGGYIKFARADKGEGICAMSTMASYPIA